MHRVHSRRIRQVRLRKEIDHIEFPRIGLEWDQAFLHSQDAKNFVETFFWSQVYFPAACDAVDVDRDRTRSAKDLSR